jgi:hypothetical protein
LNLKNDCLTNKAFLAIASFQNFQGAILQTEELTIVMIGEIINTCEPIGSNIQK